MYVTAYVKEDGQLDCVYSDFDGCASIYDQYETASIFELSIDKYNGFCRKIIETKTNR